MLRVLQVNITNGRLLWNGVDPNAKFEPNVLSYQRIEKMKSSTEDLERWPDNEGNKIFQNFDDAVGLEIKWNEIWEARFGGGIRWANCWMDVFQIADEVISE